MLEKPKVVLVAVLWIVAFLVCAASPRLPGSLNMIAHAAPAAAPDGQKTTGPPAAPPPTRDERLGAAEDYARKLLLLMDTDKNGRVSKKEFMSFMSDEFDRMDVNHDGELDVKELTGLRVKSYPGK